MIKKVDEKKACELVNSKILECKENKKIRGVEFEKKEYFRNEDSSEWKEISEYVQRIPIDKFDEIIEESKYIINQIHCFINIPGIINSQIEINLNYIQIEINTKDYKQTLKISSLEKRG